MPRLVNRLPSYRKHRASGQAIVNLNGQDHYLGPYGTKASRTEYDRLIAEWINRGKQPAHAEAELTIMELLDGFLEHAETYYRGADGTPAKEYGNFCDALRPLKRLYGLTPAAEFGPLALRGVRDEMLKLGWCRTHTNRQVNRLRHVFKWAASRELLPASVHQALEAVEGLRAGRSGARENEPVRPVPDAEVYAVKDYVNRQVWALIELQLLTGMGKLKPLELRVILVYMRHADNYSGEAYLGVKDRLTAEVGSTNTARVLRAVKDLEARGVLAEVEKGGRIGGRNKATLRRIVLPARRPPRSR